MQERLDLYKVEIEENELNLRRNIILGGIFYFDMLQIPPQPKRIANWIICQLETPQVFLDIIQARDRIKYELFDEFKAIINNIYIRL